MVGIPSSVGNKVCQFREIGVEVDDRDTQSCHRLKKDKSQTIVKLSSMKDFLVILRKKRQLCDIEPAVLDLPSDTKTFINEIFCPYYRDIWSKC